MFRPPICRGAHQLDRAFFQKRIPLKAARVFDNKNISKIRSELLRSRDSLQLERLAIVRPDPELELAKLGSKCILLRPEVHPRDAGLDQQTDDTEQSVESDIPINGTWPHSSVLSDLLDQQLISIIPYELHLDYSYWTYFDIIASILPEDKLSDIPSGFAIVGHVAHLNLRDEYLPYKTLIAEIIIDKNPGIRTVINKIDDVGDENEFRTFRYEVLAGPDDMDVEVSEGNCTFRFDYSKVYWNTRLQTEHRRLVSLFKEGEAVCDLMAGIGPFAVPAGKNGVFVLANDLNPESVLSLQNAISRNRVGSYVRAFNRDARAFVRESVAQLVEEDREVQIFGKTSRKDQNPSSSKPPPPPTVIKTLVQPKTFQHFVLNLPASATTFLSSFIGLYHPIQEKLPNEYQLPLIHVYCFSTKDEHVDDGSTAEDKICAEISHQLQHEMKAGNLDEGDVEIFDVRDVAPNKRMFCASFRLPREVAFRVP